jgi:hypothetical protein
MQPGDLTGGVHLTLKTEDVEIIYAAIRLYKLATKLVELSATIKVHDMAPTRLTIRYIARGDANQLIGGLLFRKGARKRGTTLGNAALLVIGLFASRKSAVRPVPCVETVLRRWDGLVYPNLSLEYCSSVRVA